MSGRFSSTLAKSLIHPLRRIPMPTTITAVNTGDPDIALTFDDGPDPEWTPRLLDLLKARDVKATFFVVGESCSQHPEIVQRAAAEGHAVCNHGWSHKSLPKLSMPKQIREIRKCAEALDGIGFRLFRPPYGHQSIRSRWSARLASHRVVSWSAQIEDWRRQPADQLFRRLQDVLVPGAIILLHDGIATSAGVTPSRDLQFNRSDTFNALDRILEAYGNKYNFITVPELLERGRPRRESWYRYSENAG